jgi:predicted nucleic acid-binding protein
MTFLWDSNILRHYLEDHPLLYFDEQSLVIAGRLKGQVRTRKRYADILIAAQVLAGRHVLVTRNTDDFRDLLPADQLQNWVDDEIS